MACRLIGAKPLSEPIVNLTIRTKFQWNFNQNYNIFIQENAFESVIWKTAAILSRPQCVDSLAGRRFEWNFISVFFKLNLAIHGWGISHEIALGWKSLDLADDKSTLVQVMAWCCQATSHYLNQCWPRTTSPYGDKYNADQHRIMHTGVSSCQRVNVCISG